MFSVYIATIELDDAICLPHTSKTIDFLNIMRLAFLGRIPLQEKCVRVRIVCLFFISRGCLGRNQVSLYLV